MPYGVAREAGGDSLENTAKMERCVKDVMAKGNSKESAIRICKAQLFGKKEGRRNAR